MVTVIVDVLGSLDLFPTLDEVPFEELAFQFVEDHIFWSATFCCFRNFRSSMWFFSFNIIAVSSSFHFTHPFMNMFDLCGLLCGLPCLFLLTCF